MGKYGGVLRELARDYLQQPQEFARPKSITRRRVKCQFGIENMMRILLN